jgi:hypothetical protein
MLLKGCDKKIDGNVDEYTVSIDPDPLVRVMDPRIRIRIHTKMSWIRNTGWLVR